MSKPSTFVATFTVDYVEEIEEEVNEYAKSNSLEIKSISVFQTGVGVIAAAVVFERSEPANA
jgi:hypothetical protein